MYLENKPLISLNEYIAEKFPTVVWDSKFVSVFSSFNEELDALKNGVGLRVISDPTIIKLVGKDCLDFLHRVSTNEVKNLSPFYKKNTIFLNEKGRIIARTTLIVFDGEYWLLSDPDPNVRLLSWVNKFIISEDIRTENYSSRFSMLELVGPQAESFLMLLIGNEINRLGNDEFRRFDVDGFTFYLFRSLENHSTVFFKFLVDKNRYVDFLEHLNTIKSVFDLAFVGNDAYNHFRIEKLIPASPGEINIETNPHEVNLMKEVCSTKGCYIGQEVIARLDTYDKVQQKLVKVVMGGKVEESDNIIYDSAGNEVGKLTTVCNAAQDGKALSLLKKKLILSPNGYYVNSSEGKISVKIVELEKT